MSYLYEAKLGNRTVLAIPPGVFHCGHPLMWCKAVQDFLNTDAHGIRLLRLVEDERMEFHPDAFEHDSFSYFKFSHLKYSNLNTQLEDLNTFSREDAEALVDVVKPLDMALQAFPIAFGTLRIEGNEMAREIPACKVLFEGIYHNLVNLNTLVRTVELVKRDM